MSLKEIISISGISGLKILVHQRHDGLIVSELDGSGKRFLSSRKHLFTPLENISIYTQTDSEPLAHVLWKMKQLSAEVPVADPSGNEESLKAYMARILPEYDRDQVYLRDIKKLIRWFGLLDPLGLIDDPQASESGETVGGSGNDEESTA